MASQALILRCRYRLRAFLARHPRGFLMVYRSLPRFRQVLIAPDSELLIEGFPRSANTFSVRAFARANPAVRIAHHMHAQAHVRLAVQRGLPCIVLIREPEDAIRSLLVRHPHITPALAVRTYLEFYRDLLPLRRQFVTAPFDVVTEDFSRIVAAVNRHFGTAFSLFEHSADGVRQVFGDIDRANASAFGGNVNHRFVPRPDATRSQLKSEVPLTGVEAGLAEAGRLYQAYLQA